MAVAQRLRGRKGGTSAPPIPPPPLFCPLYLFAPSSLPSDNGRRFVLLLEEEGGRRRAFVECGKKG